MEEVEGGGVLRALSKAGNTHQSSALDASRSSTASMLSTSTSCLEPMLLPSPWLLASCCSCVWVSHHAPVPSLPGQGDGVGVGVMVMTLSHP